MCGGSGCKYEDFWGFCSVRYPYPADAECMIAAGLPEDDDEEQDTQSTGFGEEE